MCVKKIQLYNTPFQNIRSSSGVNPAATGGGRGGGVGVSGVMER